jgi:glutathione synthase/RimK-type ligase-like ATP-grasp enzyme
VVDCSRSDIIDRLREVDGLLWHFHHQDAWSRFAAFPVLFSAEAMGLRVFPGFRTVWHFDDKIAQKYLLESLGAPLAPAWVFYSREAAFEWIAGTSFPKVFKLAGGAGSTNVKLVHSEAEARKLVQRAFGEGFDSTPAYLGDMRRKIAGIQSTAALLEKAKRAPQALRRARTNRQLIPREKGYVYFQEFLPDNDHDTRVTVIGNRAFGFRRSVRPGDFRASGSGIVDYDPEGVDRRCVEVAFETARRLGSQSVAFDFVRGPDGSPHIVEISYGYLAKNIHDCPGHWDGELSWREGPVWPEHAILEDLIR